MKKEEDPIKKWKRLRKKVKRVLDTTEIHHHEAYLTAKDKFLMENKEVVYDKLDDKEIQEKFADEMANYYIERAKEYFNLQRNLKDYEKDILLLAYADTTRLGLRQLVTQHGSDFTYKKYSAETPKLIKKLGEKLTGAISEHFTEKHIEDILEETELDKIINPEKLTLPEALGYLEVHEEEGLSKKGIVKQLKRKKPYLLTEEGEEYAKKAA